MGQTCFMIICILLTPISDIHHHNMVHVIFMFSCMNIVYHHLFRWGLCVCIHLINWKSQCWLNWELLLNQVHVFDLFSFSWNDEGTGITRGWRCFRSIAQSLLSLWKSRSETVFPIFGLNSWIKAQLFHFKYMLVVYRGNISLMSLSKVLMGV